LRHQIEVTADPTLIELLQTLSSAPMPAGVKPDAPSSDQYAGVVVPLQLKTEDGILSFFSTTTVFGTPVDITLAELAIESFFPANVETALKLSRS